MKLYFFLAWKYLTGQKKSAFISLNSFFSISGVSLGVAALIIVTSVMNGFRAQLIETALSGSSHLQIQILSAKNTNNTIQQKQATNIAIKSALENSAVESAYLLLSSQALLKKAKQVTVNDVYHTLKHKTEATAEAYDHIEASPIMINAVEAANAKIPVFKNLISGNLPAAANDHWAYIGSGLASQHNLKIGDYVQIYLPIMKKTSFAAVRPVSLNLKVAGIFSIGKFDYDTGNIFMSFNMLKKYIPQNQATICINLHDYHQAPQIQGGLWQKIKEKFMYSNLSGFDIQITDWLWDNQQLLNALKIEKSAMSMILSLIVIVAVLNIVGSLVMLVQEKQKDIAILRTIGVPGHGIMLIFIFISAAIGLIGVTAGVIIGCVFSFNIDYIKECLESLSGFTLFDSALYFFYYLPVKVNYGEITAICLGTMFLALISGLYPAYKAAKIDPTKILKHS